jgi:hypothetical protein
LPCSPPPHEAQNETKAIVKTAPPSFGRRESSSTPTAPRLGKKIKKTADTAFAVRGTGAVVAMLIVTVESPLPDGICAGLKAQVVNGGKLELSHK